MLPGALVDEVRDRPRQGDDPHEDLPDDREAPQPVVGVVERRRRHREQRDERAPERSHRRRRTSIRSRRRHRDPLRVASSRLRSGVIAHLLVLRVQSRRCARRPASGDCPGLDAENHRSGAGSLRAHERRRRRTTRTRRSPTTSRPPARRPTATVEPRAQGDRVHGDRRSGSVLRKKEKPAAEIFSVSYVAEGGDANRPVTFVFNGGPGASSAYLHMGAVGPQRVDFPPDGTLPDDAAAARRERVVVARVHRPRVRRPGRDRLQPRHRDREEGRRQGRARRTTRADPKEYFGYKRDLESLCEFMGRWLSEHGRWGSPSSSPARATAATASVGSCGCSRRPRASG